MSDVFAYGTLQLAEVVEAVTDRRFEGEPATLAGYRRRRLLERTYPGIVPAPGEITNGIVFRDVGAESLALLDVFEGEIYERRMLEVSVADGRCLEAWVYVVSPAHCGLLSAHAWDLDDFRLEHGEAFALSCRRWRTDGVA